MCWNIQILNFSPQEWSQHILCKVIFRHRPVTPPSHVCHFFPTFKRGGFASTSFWFVNCERKLNVFDAPFHSAPEPVLYVGRPQIWLSRKAQTGRIKSVHTDCCLGGKFLKISCGNKTLMSSCLCAETFNGGKIKCHKFQRAKQPRCCVFSPYKH